MTRWFVPVVLLALGLALGVALVPAHAGGCATSYSTFTPTYFSSYSHAYPYAYSTPVKVVKKEVAVPVAVYPVFVPAYTASYVPPAATPAPAAAAPAAQNDTRAILDALKAIDGRLRALEAPGLPPPAMRPAAPQEGYAPRAPAPAHAPGAGKAPAVFGAKCARCHTRGGEKGGFVLVEPDGRASALDARQALATVRSVYSGRMPPRSSGVPALTDQEVGEVMGWLETLK